MLEFVIIIAISCGSAIIEIMSIVMSLYLIKNIRIRNKDVQSWQWQMTANSDSGYHPNWNNSHLQYWSHGHDAFIRISTEKNIWRINFFMTSFCGYLLCEDFLPQWAFWMHQGFAVVSRIFTTLTFENMYNCASLFEYAYQINFLEFTKKWQGRFYGRHQRSTRDGAVVVTFKM